MFPHTKRPITRKSSASAQAMDSLTACLLIPAAFTAPL
jgi:hypothetical protein